MGFYVLIGAVIMGFASVFFSEPVSSVLYHLAALVFLVYWILACIGIYKDKQDPVEKLLNGKKKKKD